MAHRDPLPRLLVAATILIVAAITALAQDQPWSQNVSPLPAPTGMVNDYAGVLDAATKQQLEQKLTSFRDTTDPKVEIGVAIVKTTGDRDIFDYSLAVARGWGIGSKDDNNPSALLFIAIDDRKYFTQVSRDLEPDLPDGAVGSIQRQYLVPEFKKANYGKGISDTLDAYITTIRNKGNAPVAASTPTPGSSGSGGAGIVGTGFNIFCCAVILLIVLVSVFGNRRRGSRHRGGWGGGPFGGGGGVSSALPWIIGSAISGLGDSSSSGASSSDWGGSSGGSDWGGFGGGGDFGGGGSGGDW